MTIPYYLYLDTRTIEAPFGAFSHVELETLFKSKNAKGRPLGRNAIRFWLFLLTRASGRKTQGYQVNKSELKDVCGLSKSSAYEALADLLFCGLLVQPDPLEKVFFLSTPNPEVSEVSDGSVRELRLHTNTSTSVETNKKPLTPSRGKSELEITISKIITATPWLLAGSIHNSTKENTKALLEVIPDLMVNRLVVHSDTSLLRTQGYHGPLRKRAVKTALEHVLVDLLEGTIHLEDSTTPEPSPPPPPLDLPDWYLEDRWKTLPTKVHPSPIIEEWRDVLKGRMGSQFSIWIAPTNWSVVRGTGGEIDTKLFLLVQCPNRHFLEWVKQHYGPSIKALVEMEVVFIL